MAQLKSYSVNTEPFSSIDFDEYIQEIVKLVNHDDEVKEILKVIEGMFEFVEKINIPSEETNLLFFLIPSFYHVIASYIAYRDLHKLDIGDNDEIMFLFSNAVRTHKRYLTALDYFHKMNGKRGDMKACYVKVPYYMYYMVVLIYLLATRCQDKYKINLMHYVYKHTSKERFTIKNIARNVNIIICKISDADLMKQDFNQFVEVAFDYFYDNSNIFNYTTKVSDGIKLYKSAWDFYDKVFQGVGEKNRRKDEKFFNWKHLLNSTAKYKRFTKPLYFYSQMKLIVPRYYKNENFFELV